VGLRAEVFTTPLYAKGDCSNGGISSKFETVTFVNVDGPFEPDDRAPAVMLLPGNLGPTVKAVPAYFDPETQRWCPTVPLARSVHQLREGGGQPRRPLPSPKTLPLIDFRLAQPEASRMSDLFPVARDNKVASEGGGVYPYVKGLRLRWTNHYPDGDPQGTLFWFLADGDRLLFASTFKNAGATVELLP